MVGEQINKTIMRINNILKIQVLYKKIPSFKCKPNCHECCGPIPFSPSEWESIPIELRKKPLEDTCPLLGPAGCLAYEKRPFICRLMGTVNDFRLDCPQGCKPNKPLKRRIGNKLMQKYLELSREEGPTVWCRLR